MTMLPSLLIVDDEKNSRDALEQLLNCDYEVFLAKNFDDAVTLMKNGRFDIVLTDLRMSGKNGMFVIEEALRRPYNPICIMMSAYGSVETAVDAIKHGAYDFVTKPIDLTKLEILMKNALTSRKSSKKKTTTISDIAKPKCNIISNNDFSPEKIIGHSDAITSLLQKVNTVAKSSATVLFDGETGTGKELFANAVHFYSQRKTKPFVAVHCASLQKNLLESELFGHEKGAFTGADTKRIGLFEHADGGTLFFDEIGEIDLETQVKLLRFLESRTFNRVGSNEDINVDVRIICATNRDLGKMVSQGTFRDDLLYRLNVVTLTLPPLRDRADDIPELLNYYAKMFSDRNNVENISFNDAAIDILCHYQWPGNIRELRNFCENSVIFYSGQTMTPNNLDKKFLCPKLQTKISSQ